MDKEVFVLELSRPERDFLLAVFEAGMAHLSVTSLCAKLRAVREEPVAPAAPAAEEAPAA